MQTGLMPQFDLLFIKSMLKMQELKTHLRTNEATEGKAYENIFTGCVIEEESVISVFFKVTELFYLYSIFARKQAKVIIKCSHSTAHRDIKDITKKEETKGLEQ